MNAVNHRIYAEDWYLDCVCPKSWDCLVYGDYEAVMPLPFTRKFFLKFISQPLFCQQLGVFSPKQELVSLPEFYNFLKKELVRGYNFNSENNLASDFLKTEVKINQILKFEDSYQATCKKYNRLRNRNIRKFYESGFTVSETEKADDMISEFRNEFHDLNIPDFAYKNLKSLFKKSIENGKGIQRIALKEGRMVASGFWAVSKGRIYYIFSSNSPQGKEFGATTSLVDSVIKDYSGENFFDFEGSNLPKVHNFNKSFGAEDENYFFYRNFPI